MRETVSCKPSYAAGLLWVNHDANNMKAQPHRQRVFTHIQQRYRPWQRRDSALKLRQGVKLPITDAHPPSESLESEEDRSEISVTKTLKCPKGHRRRSNADKSCRGLLPQNHAPRQALDWLEHWLEERRTVLIPSLSHAAFACIEGTRIRSTPTRSKSPLESTTSYDFIETSSSHLNTTLGRRAGERPSRQRKTGRMWWPLCTNAEAHWGFCRAGHKWHRTSRRTRSWP